MGNFRALARRLLRGCLRRLVRLVYRVKVLDKENLQFEGGALLVANHLSVVDGLLLLAAFKRPVRILIRQDQYDQWWIRPVAKLLNSIPINPQGSPHEVRRSLRVAAKAVAAGELVCIFPEGQTSRTGMLQPFSRGAELILRASPVPVVPIYLDRVWGSIFSYAGGKYYTKWPERLPYRVTLAVGEPLPATLPMVEVRQKVKVLGCRAWEERKRSAVPLHRRFVRLARRRPWKVAAQELNAVVSRLGLLVRGVALARSLREQLEGSERVGVLVPPSVAGVATNLALALGGKVSVNLNPTTGKAPLEAALKQAEITTVIASEQLLNKLKVELPNGVEVICLEGVAKEMSRWTRMRAVFAALLLPVGALERFCGRKRPIGVDDPATILFTSGSSGAPKGVVLTHFNLLANVEACAQILPVSGDAMRLLHALPLFHSFGLMALWFGLISGGQLVLHPSPFDAVRLGRLIKRAGVNLLFSTSTFLRLWAKRWKREQLGSLEVIIAGAEKLSPAVAALYREQFDVAVLEGYGMTECAPVVATNTLDVGYVTGDQIGHVPGSVGQALPGVAVRAAHLETGEVLPVGSEGVLQVKGCNVMQGYLNQPERTAEVIRDGWYDTGDVGSVDPAGYIHITDRLSRFSKIGGEMVPHQKVEEELQHAVAGEEPTFRVTAIPDPKKGEQLVVLYTCGTDELESALDRLQERGLSNLMIPRRERCLSVEQFPCLPTGKIDLKGLKRLAMERLA